MSPRAGAPPKPGQRWTWLLVAAVILALARLAWSVAHHAPSTPDAVRVTTNAGVPAGGADALAWTPIAGAEQRSRESGKPILYDFNAAWCGPCQMLGREVFDNASRARVIAGQVVPVSVVDRYREDGHNTPEVEALQQRFQVEAFPTLVVLSPATGRFQKFEGYMGADATVDWITHSATTVR